MLYRQEAEAILAAWREVERDIAAVAPGSPEFVRLYIEARQLRDEYQRLIDVARLNLRPEPPPFPAAVKRVGSQWTEDPAPDPATPRAPATRPSRARGKS